MHGCYLSPGNPIMPWVESIDQSEAVWERDEIDPIPLSRKITVTVVWTCTLVISLLVECCHAQKLNVHWGPQSMMYLKGKHGRRFVSENDSSVLKQGLQGLYAVLRGIQKQSRGFSKPGHIVSSDKVLIHFLQER